MRDAAETAARATATAEPEHTAAVPEETFPEEMADGAEEEESEMAADEEMAM